MLVFGNRRGLLRQAGSYRVEHAVRRIEQRLLRHGGEAHAALHDALAIVECDVARDAAQQRRFAGAVAADQRQPFARLDGQVDPVEQRDVAVGEMNVL